MDKLELLNAVPLRHSVRQFKEYPIEPELLALLNLEIEKVNQESGISFQLITDDKDTFNTLLSKYNRFKNAFNYIAVVVKRQGDFSEKIGYYGQMLVLKAQALGLNTCWAGVSYNKHKCKTKVDKDQKVFITIALGYGQTQGISHKSKPIESFYTSSSQTPKWFIDGVKCAMLCPTAINQQKFHFTLDGNTVKATTRFGPYAKTDLGIAKLHFELGAGTENFVWRN